MSYSDILTIAPQCRSMRHIRADIQFTRLIHRDIRIIPDMEITSSRALMELPFDLQLRLLPYMEVSAG